MLAPIRIIAVVDHLGCWSAWVAPCPVSASVGPSPAAALQRLCDGLKISASAFGTDRERSGNRRYEFVIGCGSIDCGLCAGRWTFVPGPPTGYCRLCGGTGRVCPQATGPDPATAAQNPGRIG